MKRRDVRADAERTVPDFAPDARPGSTSAETVEALDAAEAKPPPAPAKPEDPLSRQNRLNRERGHDFERTVVHAFRKRFAGCGEWTAKVKRSDQSFRPWQPDVAGVPGLWIECRAGIDPKPDAKLRQAIRDLTAAGVDWIPVAITRRPLSTAPKVSLRAGDLAWLIGYEAPEVADEALAEAIDSRVELTLPRFFAVLAASPAWPWGRPERGRGSDGSSQPAAASRSVRGNRGADDPRGRREVGRGRSRVR